MSRNTKERKKVILITGASAGIGKAIARRFLKDGWTVYGGARRTKQMEDIRSEGAKILFLDLADEESVRTAVQNLLDHEKRIDVLVNNAGYGSYGAIEDVPLSEARRQFEVNVFGLIYLCNLILPVMRGAGSGRIINVSSMAGRIWTPFGGWYYATKHALEVLSDAMRMETKPFGVYVIVIQPGAINSEWSEIAAKHLLQSSQGSPYRAFLEPMANMLKGYSFASHPDVVANVVSRAVTSRKPLRRYAVPTHAKGLVFLRWLLPDAIWERLIKLTIR